MELERAMLVLPAEAFQVNLRNHKRLCDRKAEQLRTLLSQLGDAGDSATVASVLEELSKEIDEFRTALESWDRKDQEQISNLRQRLRILLTEAGLDTQMLDLAQESAQTPAFAGYQVTDSVAKDTTERAREPAMDSGQCDLSQREVSTDATQHRLLRFLVDFMLRQGYLETARCAIERWGLAPFVDMGVFEAIVPVVVGLRANRATEALQYCAENRRRLSRLGSSLELNLRVQEFIELCRAREVNAAVLYARKHFNGLLASKPDADADPRALEEYALVKRCVTLLAYPPETSCEPYRRLYDPKRWDTLIEKFLSTHFELNMLPSVPLLDLLIEPGLAALKTRKCKPYTLETNPATRAGRASQGPTSIEGPVGHARHQEVSMSTGDAERGQLASSAFDEHVSALGDRARLCPTCAYPFNALAKDLPYSSHTHSILLCRVTGKLMDEHNPPIVLPNGNVYSAEAVDLLTEQRPDGRFVRDPATGHEFSRDICRKVFIM